MIMQIKNVKISNLISFPYIADFKQYKGISFSLSKRWNVNTLIGPNGSGKSSFLEILNQILKVGLTKDYVFHKDLLLQSDSLDVDKELADVITEHSMREHYLHKNFNFENKSSAVELILSLQINDYNNLWFVCKFADHLNAIIRKYSKLDVQFSSIDMENLQKISEITCKFEIDFEKKAIILDQKWLNVEEKFILHFVQHQELIQICMNIYNDIERKKWSREWYPLKNTYAILWSNRNFGNILHSQKRFFSISPWKRSRYISGQNTQAYYSMSIGYYLCLMKFWAILSVKHKEVFAFGNKNLKELYKDIYREEVVSSKFFQELNGIIEEYLHMSLDLESEDWNFDFKLMDSFWHSYALDELSSWDQSLLFIILTVFGYDLQSWLLVIDEPELHLHPQMQKEFIAFINWISRRYSLQIILATHSPLMINEKNIRHVYRFSKHNLKTQVDNPAFRIHADEAELIQMLKFENIAKIFFVDKIIMVEWETDAYFFEYYLNYIKDKHNALGWASVDNAHYEFLDIQWKWSFPKWKQFLNKFGIDTYFIGDWDNIVDEHIISQQQMDHYRKLSRKQYTTYIKKYNFLSKHRYGVLVETIRLTAKSLYDYIVEQIEMFYKRWIFFLKRWDLETYIGIKTKWLDDTIFFCQKRFLTRIKNPKFAEHRKELDIIFETIFKE